MLTYSTYVPVDKDRNDSVDYLSCGSKDGGMGREDPLALPRTPEGVNIAISHGKASRISGTVDIR